MPGGTAAEELPRLVLVVGVAGSGKTTVGRLLAERLGWAFRDGDEFHSEADRARMAAGRPLTDSDRGPWLEAIREWMDEAIACRRQAVVTCSALKRAYRDALLAGRPEVLLVYLHGSRELLSSRLASRHGHFFPAGLLESQLAELQEPAPDERPLVVEIDQPPEAVVTAVLSLMRRESASGRPAAGSDTEHAVPAGARNGSSPPLGPTGESWRLVHGAQSAVVVQLGGALRDYVVQGRPLLDGFSAGSAITGGRGQLLIPWPNRVGDGRYDFGGRSLQLPLTEVDKNNAIHGLLRWTLWKLLARTDGAVMLGATLCPQPGYPFLVEVRVEYRLGPEGLRTTVHATNTGTEPAPYGVGQHPYLTIATDLVDSALLTVPARYLLRTDERGLPIGRESVDGTLYDFRTARPIGGLNLDTAFTGLDRALDDRAVVRLAHPSGLRGVDLWLGEGTRYVQVYTGDTLAEPERRRRGVAVEAMSCPPDAFRSGTDLTVLEPGATHVLRWGLSPWGPP
ncbi:Galactose mutarotase-like enzyme [Streptomyces venezuelae]|uniref:gluconokinase, GntK/IdnK-type n=1 Tax=Streptomyces gardneri TaxID=66892 RepID=UPI0007215DB3|nr:gluconokinase, GntK/IdnK-type [Streptomyces gardneri]ALO12890.1 Galactose mutarotase-like enzyme [Streptomyces venezuelae]QPK49594.1 AAA family ATPase [Streptomyces gardneri]WRK41138.1 gluconokinase, GntK/IdnK-type [Streptomyces venezuelae]